MFAAFLFLKGDFHYFIHAAPRGSPEQAPKAPRDAHDIIDGHCAWWLNFARDATRRKLLRTSIRLRLCNSRPASPRPRGLSRSRPARSRQRLRRRQAASPNRWVLFNRGIVQSRSKLPAACLCLPHLPLDTHFGHRQLLGDVLAGRPIGINATYAIGSSYLMLHLAIWLWTMLFQAPHLTAINVGQPRFEYSGAGACRSCKPQCVIDSQVAKMLFLERHNGIRTVESAQDVGWA